jgi:hypothetical protein
MPATLRPPPLSLASMAGVVLAGVGVALIAFATVPVTSNEIAAVEIRIFFMIHPLRSRIALTLETGR